MAESFIGFLMPVSRYIYLALTLIISVRVLIAMFAKKVTDPERGRLISKITGESVPLYDREISVGRSKSCDLILGYGTISRLHAVIAFRSKGFVVFDTNSKSGVLVNGKRINKKAEIKDGDVLSFGGLEYILKTERYKYIKDKSGRLGRPSYPLLLLLLTVFNILSLILNSSPDGELNASVIVTYVAFIALQWLYIAFASFFLRINNFELEILAFLFASLGMAITGSIYPDTVIKQLAAIVIGVVGFCALTIILRYIEFVKVIRWIGAVGAIGLLGLTLLIAEPNNGALNWISLGGVSLQPSELVKVVFVFVGAVTLERLQSMRHLTAYVIFAAFCVGELFLMKDFGAALIFFFTFVIIAFMRSGDIRTILLVCMAAALGAGLIIYFKPYVADRFATYTKVWEYMDEGGFQQTRVLIYSVSGGLFGLGLGNGELRNVFAAAEDLVFGVVCEEFGCIMGFIPVIVYAAVAVYAVINAKKAKSTFYSIGAVASSGLLLFQTMLSVFGITDLLPLTGVTVPFISKGGSSVICCFCLYAFIKAADPRTYASFKPEAYEGGAALENNG